MTTTSRDITNAYHKPITLECAEAIRLYAEEYSSRPEYCTGQRIYGIAVTLPVDLLNMFNEEMKKYDLPEASINKAGIIIIKRKDFHLININKAHVDMAADGINPVNASIVIPVLGYKDTDMYWLKGTPRYTVDNQSTPNTGTPIKHPIWDNPDQVEIIRTEIDGPTLCRIGGPHDATSHVDGSYRVSISLRLKNNPTFEELYEKIPNRKTNKTLGR
jgi:hypothetical protein